MDGQPRVALVSMPWMAPSMPSIQLATLGAALRGEGIVPDIFEFYVDFAARVGLALYQRLSRLLGFNAEWVLARQYFGPEEGNHLEAFLDDRPGFGLSSRVLEVRILRALDAVAEEWIDELVADQDWKSYDLVGFSLTLSQLGGSMALARRIKLIAPNVRIVFGGAQCAGPMGRAILRSCPYVDAVVQVEGEPVITRLAVRARNGRSFQGLAGVVWRDDRSRVRHQPGEVLDIKRHGRPFLSYDAYFERLRAQHLQDVIEPWIPFESSRGCWYGEKVQCTFCGLHEIMAYRDQSFERVLDELEHLWEAYEIPRFFAVDLIMPRAYLETLLPAIEATDRDWRIFYEMKANMRRHEVEQLARAGVRWIQPGIESLDAELLKLMRKGVRPLQNIQLLKWCRENGVRVGWNMIRGIPGERAGSYERMSSFIPRLVHLAPPSGVGQFQLHRFSPYFDEPARFGVQPLGAHPHFEHVFPIDPEDRDDLVYLHDFRVDGEALASDVVQRFEHTIHSWWKAYTGGARLLLRRRDDGTAVIVDGRNPDVPPRRHALSTDEADLYEHLDVARSERSLGTGGSAPDCIDRWDRDGLVLRMDGQVLALAVRAEPFLAHIEEEHGPTPVAYLDDDLAHSG